MSAFEKKKKKKSTMSILIFLNLFLYLGVFGLYHLYIGSYIRFIGQLFYFIAIFLLYDSSDSTGVVFLILFLVLLPSIFEIIMLRYFPDSIYYRNIAWI
jgi:hypothetical protein